MLHRTLVKFIQSLIGSETAIKLYLFVADGPLCVAILLIFIGRSLEQDILESGPNGHKVIVAHPRFLDIRRDGRSIVEVMHVFILGWR